MKRAMFLTLAIVMVLSLALAGCGGQPAAPTAAPPTKAPAEETKAPEPPAQETLEISVACDATWPPFEMVNETTKELEGFDIDLMTAIAEEANLKVNWVNVGWDPLLAGMATGQYDAAISVITITEDRAKDMLFSDPYYNAGQLVAVRVDNTDINGPADLAGKVAGAQLGTTGEMEIQKVEGATAKGYDDVGQAFLDLINGQIDAVVADSPLVVGYVGKNADTIKSVGEPFTDEYYGIAVKKGGEEILARINAGLKTVLDRGIIDELNAKWLVGGAEEEPAEETLAITVATDATWPPFEMVNETSKELEGFDIDLMNAIAEAGNLEVEFVNVGWDPLLAGMATGQYDAAISCITITEERKQDMLFSDPYYNAGQLVAVRVDNTDIAGPEDLVGKTVGTQMGTTGDIEVQGIEGATSKGYDDVGQAFLDLINGQVDAVVADSPLVIGYVGKNADTIKTVGEPFTDEYYGIAVKKGGEEILARINKGVKAVLDQGLIEELNEKWLVAE